MGTHDSTLAGRRAFLRVAAASVGGLVLAACGAPSTPSGGASITAAADASAAESASAPAGAAGKTNITLWYWGSEAFQKASIDLFNNSQSNVFVALRELA